MRQMVRLVVVVALVGLVAPAGEAVAQQTTSSARSAEFKRGTNKMKIGALLFAGGVFLVVADNSRSDRRQAAEARAVGAVGIGSGMGFILWGARQRQNASRPQISIGATLGTSTGVFITRR